MAFAAEIAALVEELVGAVKGSNAKTNERTLKRTRDTALRSLRSRTHLRTNQFEVERQLGGLEERFRIHSRDALADALSDRLDTLRAKPAVWHPEILALLLELSDQPTQKTKLSDLEALGIVKAETSETLRWEDIAKEDGWDQDGSLWRTIRYDSSSDDGLDAEQASQLSDTTDTSAEVDHAARRAEDYVIRPEDIEQLNSLRTVQAWRDGARARGDVDQQRKTGVPEVHLLREVLFMLQGLPTSLFDTRGIPVTTCQLEHVSWEVYRAVMNGFAESGRQLRILREFVEEPQIAPHLQVFQDCICARLDTLDARLSALEAQLLAPEGQVAVSLVAAKAELDLWLEPLHALAGIVERCDELANSKNPFSHLEIMFEEASAAQLAGRASIYEFLARMFTQCFNIYLRPIRLWIEEGQLVRGDEVFFITESPTPVPPGKVWSERFWLRQDADGNLHAPNFLRPAASAIFNAGKSIVLLKQLGRHIYLRAGTKYDEAALDFDKICPLGLELAPWPDLFGSGFDQWVQARYQPTSSLLKETLFDTCGLLSSVDALHSLFFMSNGAAGALFCDNLFGKLQAGDPRWYDKYALGSVAQEAWSTEMDPDRISIHIAGKGKNMSPAVAHASVREALPFVMVDFRLSWPVQTVVTSESFELYRAIFTLLLQVRRAMYALHRSKLLKGDQYGGGQAVFFSSRAKLLWFCSVVQMYVTAIVLEPNVRRMRQALVDAQDVDALRSAHLAALRQITTEACLGSKLAPIQECIGDVLDLAIQLDGAWEEYISVTRARKKGSLGNYELAATVDKIKTDFARHLRFIREGLRGVARVTSDSQSARWDMLADMLQGND